jgi:hypothetical protein
MYGRGLSARPAAGRSSPRAGVPTRESMAVGPYDAPTPRPASRCGTPDIRMWQNEEIYNKRPGETTAFAFGMKHGPGGQAIELGDVGFEDVYLYFDSYQADYSNAAAGEITWNISTYNNGRDITDLVQVQVSRFRFPKVYTDPAGPDYVFYYGKTHMQVVDLPTNASVATTGGKYYHWEFDVTDYTATAVMLEPARPNFYLRTPLTSLSKFDLIFSRPSSLTGINLPRANITCDLVFTVIPGGTGYNPARFSVTTGDSLLELFGYVGVPVTPAAIEFLNFPLVGGLSSAQPMWYVTFVAADYFEVAGMDTTSIVYNTLPVVPPAISPVISGQIGIAKNRIAIETRFTCQRETRTNMITAAHF